MPNNSLSGTFGAGHSKRPLSLSVEAVEKVIKA
jgi:hypothetical protein